MSIAGAIADARKSATRMYINNFADKGRQNTIDILLVPYYTSVILGVSPNLLIGTFDGPNPSSFIRPDQ